MKPKFLKLFLVAATLVFASWTVGAQNKWALKTNLLHDATLSANLAIEYAFAPKWSIEISGSYHPEQLKLGNVRLAHWAVQPEIKYWLCERYQGFFLDIHAVGGSASVGGFPLDFSKLPGGVDLNTYLLEPWFIGGGLGLGYDVVLSRHWNLEFELGLGYAYIYGSDYEMIKNADGTLSKPEKPYYTGAYLFPGPIPTKLALTVMYIF